MPLIPYPIVPILPGVPSIPRIVGQAIPPVVAASLGIVSAMLGAAFQAPSQWGIYDQNGNPLIDTSGLTLFSSPTILSTLSVEYTKETRISDFPVEEGGFASYNKVEMPANPTVTLSLSGSESDRAAFLSAIDGACKSTALVSIATPEITYINYTFERYDYRRMSSRGCTLLTVEIHLKEIRQVLVQYSSTPINSPQNAGANPATDSGQVQPQTPSGSTQQSTLSKLMGG